MPICSTTPYHLQGRIPLSVPAVPRARLEPLLDVSCARGVQSKRDDSDEIAQRDESQSPETNARV